MDENETELLRLLYTRIGMALGPLSSINKSIRYDIMLALAGKSSGNVKEYAI